MSVEPESLEPRVVVITQTVGIDPATARAATRMRAALMAAMRNRAALMATMIAASRRSRASRAAQEPHSPPRATSPSNAIKHPAVIATALLGGGALAYALLRGRRHDHAGRAPRPQDGDMMTLDTADANGVIVAPTTTAFAPA